MFKDKKKIILECHLIPVCINVRTCCGREVVVIEVARDLRFWVPPDTPQKFILEFDLWAWIYVRSKWASKYVSK
jgi:hypothetical protein